MKLIHLLSASTLLFSNMAYASEIPFPEQKTLQKVVVSTPQKKVLFNAIGPRPGFAGYYLAARHAQAEQDWLNANHYFDIVSRKDPSNTDMHRRTMVLAMGSGDLELAAEYASNILNVNSDDALASLFVSAKNFKNKEYKESLQKLSSMSDGGMADFTTPILYSWTKAALGQFDISELKKQPLDAFHAALISKMMKQKAEGLSFLNDVAARQNDVPSLKLADAFLVLGEHKTAKEMYLRLAAEQTNYGLKERLTYIKEGKQSQKPLFLKPLSVNDGIATAYIDMAKILYAQDSGDSARIFANIGLSISPNIEDGHILLASLYTETGQFQEAIDQYRQVSPYSRYAIEIQLKIAEIQESLDEKEAAINELSALNEKKPARDLLIQIADIQRRDGKYQEAISHYNDVIGSFSAKVPDDYWFLYYVRGMSFERLGDWAKAEKDFEAALSYQPNDPFVLNYLAYGWVERNKNLQKSLEYLEKAVSRRPADGHIRDSLGWTYYKLGQYHEAIEPLERAISYLPYDPIVNEHLGDAYWQVGRQREALFQWQRALNHIEDADQEIEMSRLQDKLATGLPIEEKVVAAEIKNAPLSP